MKSRGSPPLQLTAQDEGRIEVGIGPLAGGRGTGNHFLTVFPTMRATWYMDGAAAIDELRSPAPCFVRR